MRIAILETGQPPREIRADFPSYPAMFRRLLAPAAPEFVFTDYNVVDGAPPDPAEHDGFLITGSPAGVYEDLAWTPPLFDAIRAAAAIHTPVVGICFGHQAVAHALGGKVVKSEKGMCVGRHVYDVLSRPDWMAGAPDQFALPVSHQDQVVAAPEDARILAASDFTPFAALYYPHAPALTFQGHPEFEDAFAAALYGARRNGALTSDAVDAAVASLDAPEDNALTARWIAEFFRTHAR